MQTRIKEKIMPLLLAPEGQKLKIVKMAVDERAQARLNALGLAEGCFVFG